MKLSTLRTVALHGPVGELTIDDPGLVALLVILAVSGRAGIERDELMVLLTPDATSDRARNELDRLLAAARFVTGDNTLIVHPATRYGLREGALELDIEVLPPDSGHGCDEFLSGFTLPGSPEFADWLTAARRRVASREGPSVVAPAVEVAEADTAPAAMSPASTSLAAPSSAAPSPAAPSRGRRRWIVTGSALLMVGAMAVTLVRVATPRSVAGFVAGDPVLLADLANDTGDSLFDKSIIAAASVALQQSAHLRLYPRGRLAGVYQLMQIANRDTALTYELAREVAERDRVRFVLGLRLFRDAGGYRISARLADVQLGKEVSDDSEPAERESEIISALDRVLLTVRGRLGESPADIRARRLPLPRVTTASLEALRSYAEGKEAWDKGNYPRAGELWFRAVDLDTGFAAAYGSLGAWHNYGHDRVGAERYYREAMRRSDRLTEWERLRVLAGIADFRGTPDSTIVLYQVMATRFPNVSNWYNYGTTLMQNDRYEDAIAAFATALTFDSLHVNSYINLATSSGALQRDDDALRFYLKAGAIDSMALRRNNINQEWGSTHVRLGRPRDAEAAFRPMLTSAKIGDRASGMRSMGYLALWEGLLGKAVEYFAQASEATAQTQAPLGEARNRLLLAAVLQTATRTAEANAEVTRVLTLMSSTTMEPRFLALLALRCLRLDRPSDADSVLRVLKARMIPDNADDRAAASLATGALWLARARPDSALPLLTAAIKRSQPGLVLTLRAEAFAATGELDSARVDLERLLSRPEFGEEGQVEWQQASFALAEVLRSQGDTSKAVAAYKRYLEQWRDAPSALPRVVAARARLRELSRSKR